MPEYLHPGVYVQEVPSAVRPIEGVSTSTAAFIGVATKGPIPGTRLPNGEAARPVMVTSFTEYLRHFGGYRDDSFLTYAARAFFDNGGRRLYVVRVARTLGDGAARAASNSLGVGEVQISAASEGKWGNDVWIRVAPSSTGDGETFKFVVMLGLNENEARQNVVETFDQVSPRDARTRINNQSEYIVLVGDLEAMPPAGGPAFQLLDGDDGKTSDVDHVGSPAESSTLAGSGLYALDKVVDVNLIAIPGQGSSDVINRGVEYCKNRSLQDCFFIADAGWFKAAGDARRSGAHPEGAGTHVEARDFAKGLNRSFGDYGAIYFPWVWAPDWMVTGTNPRILLPPSGFVAGLYARIDNSRGVFKAPAGTEAGLAGALAPAVQIGDSEQDILNPNSVNAIRTVPAGGLVVWGARTFGSDTSWRYIPVRRMAIFLRVSIYNGIQWAVFEPNDEDLWSMLRLNIRAFMLSQFRAGAFQGSRPDDAFFVKCDATTTTQQDIDNGMVNILVGFAPLKPAEFVILKLSQKVNQPAA